MGSITPDTPEWDPRTVLSSLPNPTPENTHTPIPFFHLLSRLKTTKREGWQQAGLSHHGESIADHMYRMSIMTMFCPPALSTRISIPRCIEMALVHDMAECLVGDITPLNTDITKTEKARREEATMQYITGPLLGSIPGGGGPRGAARMMGLFREYEDNETLEARFVHDVDKLEMVLQTIEYERDLGEDLDEFYHVLGRITLPEMREWAEVLIQERRDIAAERSNGVQVNGHAPNGVNGVNGVNGIKGVRVNGVHKENGVNGAV
ncbi:HD domain-containing protein [Aspergillus puulaauensis]|uniref:5'-deoxynucleotidase n=1 Tax=Aspergillus puulaauensis TaxID=1220207 RepID=A0A7R8AQA7_9EURO|nr:uncharacterized protein APUU_50161S [Aspergillus puulaauensis]BCS25450.1 hypothetical protein APUU_50161S [Aspergillus puulaauensis]